MFRGAKKRTFRFGKKNVSFPKVETFRFADYRYTGTVLVLMFKEFFNTDINWLDFYNQMSGYVGIICTVAFSCSIVYLVQRHKKEELLRTGRAVEEKPEMLQSAFSVMPS